MKVGDEMKLHDYDIICCDKKFYLLINPITGIFEKHYNEIEDWIIQGGDLEQEVILMGALPSQKYDLILYDFCNWLKEDYKRLLLLKTDEYEKLIQEFLKQLDNKEWENNNPKTYDF